ncbi:MAG: hypothetical protein FWH23_07770 [Bacteroidales bacterium]|nr:hypothetical protein [Bacteroidales bacterium]MCL2133091.1 hypothetical protein [Bacteroidales bacterium]
MKRYILLLLVCSCQNVYSQVFSPEKHLMQAAQKLEKKLSELAQGWERSSKFSTRPTQKEVYALYMKGKKVAAFADEFGCKGQIRVFQSTLDNWLKETIAGYPSSMRKHQEQEARSAFNKYFNEANCTCRKEQNPNYQESVGNIGWGGGGNVPIPPPVTPLPNDRLDLPDNSLIPEGGSTQITNPLDATTLGARERPPANTQTAALPLSVNFEDMGNYVSDIGPNTTPRIFENMQSPEIISTIDEYGREHARIAALKPLEIEALEMKKKALEVKYWEDFTTCLKYNIKSDCSNAQFKPILDKIKSIDNLIEGGGVELIDREIGKNQEKYATQNFQNNTPWEDMSASIDNPQRLTTITNQLVQLNSGSMPTYTGPTGDGGYGFIDEEKGAVFFVDKDGNTIKFVKHKIQNPIDINPELTIGKVASIKVEDGKSSVSVTAPIGEEVSIKGESNLHGNIKMEIAEKIEIAKKKTEDFLNKDEYQEKMKELELIKFEIAGKPAVIIELSRVDIFESGDAVKTTFNIEAGKLKIGGSAGITGEDAGITGGATLDIASAKGAVSYISSPLIALNNDNFTIHQSEIGMSVGIGASVGYKVSVGVKSKGGEGSAIVKAGFVLNEYDSNKHINYLPDNEQRKVYYNLFENLIK